MAATTEIIQTYVALKLAFLWVIGEPPLVVIMMRQTYVERRAGAG
jgi:hypothetical protein